MKKLSFLIIFILFSCSNSEIPSHLLVDNGGIFYENGQKKPFNGTSIENKNGKLFKKNYYQEGVVFKTEEFYGSGKLKRIYLNQDNDFVVKVLSESGEDISNLENEFYYPNGSIYEKGRYAEGKKDGMWVYYNNDLGTQKREFWHEGLLLEIIDIKDIFIEDSVIVHLDEDSYEEKNFTGIVRFTREEDDYNPGLNLFVKILNGKITGFRTAYLSDTNAFVFKNDCSYSEKGYISEDLYFTEGKIVLQQCSFETKFFDSPEQTYVEGSLVKINENSWELHEKYFYRNGNILREIVNPANGSAGSEASFKGFTTDNMYYEAGNIHTKYELIDGKETYQRFNKNGLDISNGEGQGEDLNLNILDVSEDSPAAGFYKNGLKDGEWVTRDGVKSYTYTEGILNGPYYNYLIESYKNDGCLWEVGNYKDGLKDGEWVTFETYPKEDCGKIKDTYLYEMGELIDLTIQK